MLETGKRLRRLGHDFRIFTASVFSKTPFEEIDGVPVHRFSYGYPVLGLNQEGRQHLDKKGGNLFSLALMRALHREPDLDIIHLHTLKRLGGIGRREARRRGIPYIVTLHGGVLDVPAAEAAEMVSPLKGTLEWGKVLGLWLGSNRVLDDAAAILCVGRREQKAMLERYPGKRVVLLPNGVDSARFAEGDGPAFRRRHGIPAERRLLLVMGRIDPQKNQELALGLLERLRSGSGPEDVHLVLAGHVTNPPYRERLEKRIRESGLADRVHLIPGLDPHGQELVDAYHACDLFLLPSRHEPFGIVVLEAWAAGRPVVAAEVGGIPSFVRDGHDGLLFPPEDLDALESRVRSLLAEPERAAALARAGHRKAVQAFDWKRVTAELLSVYEEVLLETSVRP